MTTQVPPFPPAPPPKSPPMPGVGRMCASGEVACASGVPMHLRWMQGCLRVPGPPYWRMFRQKRHVVQFWDRHPVHVPHLFVRLFGIGPPFF